MNYFELAPEINLYLFTLFYTINTTTIFTFHIPNIAKQHFDTGRNIDCRFYGI